ncbi:hypothetical protein M011DRAFT_36738 [Sporormia fimetaria CBS 119925]|uniref:RING-type domain-containing protein n=1 Tax=Sporormia fimetaria CBS 119925 TaxID=1340428 RepID=A0A6A6VAR1_9PLEO|nr:hypothetical protein M011DRAFT_36738 [Sporormia fimetaria CBS 119925]
MSVAASEAAVEPLSAVNPPSSPSTTSPPSPLHTANTLLDIPSLVPAPPDMSTSPSSTQPPLDSQNHDREEDSVMQDMDAPEEDHRTDTPSPAEPQVAVQVAAVDDDTMDTTSDSSQGTALPDSSSASHHSTAPSANTTASHSTSHTNPSADNIPVPADINPLGTPAPGDPGLPPPPPPPPLEPDSDTSDDEDGHLAWHEIPEDTSEPDEAELKLIEASAEVSALDHEHWESLARKDMDLADPEYRLGTSGRIHWTIDNYNGTRDLPNREVVMKSQIITIGGYEWQIKFYPRGNDSDYLSIYVECVSVQDKSDESQSVDSLFGSPRHSSSNQHTPLPLLDSKPVRKRHSVAAHVAVVLYNPSEPRVNQFRTCAHRFCSASPDWGWTRYHGPYYEISHRVRGQRQALLRHDKLAFTAYIQIVEDATDCLWEHQSGENPWDSFAMTGLQSLTASLPVGGGHLVSVVASWMLFRPFRRLLYSISAPNYTKSFARPKPLLEALEKVLFLLRTRVKPGSPPVHLADVLQALAWYGIEEQLLKLDFTQMWEVLRVKLEDELCDTPFAGTLDALFGPKRNYSVGIPTYKLPVLGNASIQAALEKAPNCVHPSEPLPELLTLELERQVFDLPSRSYVKLLNKVSLDDKITIRGTEYTLFGFVVHRQTLQSYVYQPVLRPEGPGSRWYSYTNDNRTPMVQCLTKRQALDDHEGKTGSGQITGNDPVAYVALYVRNDRSTDVFTCAEDGEPWEVPDWIRQEVKDEEDEWEDPLGLRALPKRQLQESSSEPSLSLQLHILDSKAFLEHEGPGIVDVYGQRSGKKHPGMVHQIQTTKTNEVKDIQAKIAETVPGIQDIRQIRFWIVNPWDGTYGFPELITSDEIHRLGTYGAEDLWIWLHIVDFDQLPSKSSNADAQPDGPLAAAQGSTSVEGARDPAPVTEGQEHDNNSEETISVETISEEVVVYDDESMSASASLENAAVHVSEDTPMRDLDDDASQESEQGASTTHNAPTNPLDTDVPAASGDVRTASPTATQSSTNHSTESFPHIDHSNPAPYPTLIMSEDTEMIVAQGGAAPPPPPPVQFTNQNHDHTTIGHRPVMPQATISDEIYVFLKEFDAEAQLLKPRGSYIVPKSAKVEATVLSKLNLPADTKVDIVEENRTTVRPIRTRRSFASNDFTENTHSNCVVLIISFPLTDAQRDALAARAAFSDVKSYLKFRIKARNFPDTMNGHFTFHFFSSEYFKGEMRNGHRHGHGTRIYHSGATYEGQFRLGHRHGHGTSTFQNGDTYDGEWVADQRCGTGTFVEASTGNTYTGGWKNDRKFGEGVTHWKSAEETEKLCRICWEEGADAAFYDCGHVVACVGCARQVQSCPVCRRRVLSSMKLFYVA